MEGRRIFIIPALAAALGLTVFSVQANPDDLNQLKNEEEVHRIVVLSDVHYGTKNRDPKERSEIMERKRNAAMEITSWKDADLCVFTGDLVEKYATASEYKLAKQFTDLIKLPKAFVAGNHEVVYSEFPESDGTERRAGPMERLLHLRRYTDYFGDLYYTKRLGGYLLVFLSPDKTDAARVPDKSDEPYAGELSERELGWLSMTLEQNRDTPTLIFCHTPLEGSFLKDYPGNGERNFTQPSLKIRDLLASNPQVMFWVSGHTHTRPTSASFSNPVNRQIGTAVVDIHNPSWKGSEIWTNSIYLYKDRVEVRTYSHKDHRYLDAYNRSYAVMSIRERDVLSALASNCPRGSYRSDESAKPILIAGNIAPDGKVMKP